VFLYRAFVLSKSYTIFIQAQDGSNGSKLSLTRLSHGVAIAGCWQIHDDTKEYVYINQDDTLELKYSGLNKAIINKEDWEQGIDKLFI
jgi:hypothetical protein